MLSLPSPEANRGPVGHLAGFATKYGDKKVLIKRILQLGPAQAIRPHQVGPARL